MWWTIVWVNNIWVNNSSVGNVSVRLDRPNALRLFSRLQLLPIEVYRQKEPSVTLVTWHDFRVVIVPGPLLLIAYLAWFWIKSIVKAAQGLDFSAIGRLRCEDLATQTAWPELNDCFFIVGTDESETEHHCFDGIRSTPKYLGNGNWKPLPFPASEVAHNSNSSFSCRLFLSDMAGREWSSTVGRRTDGFLISYCFGQFWIKIDVRGLVRTGVEMMAMGFLGESP